MVDYYKENKASHHWPELTGVNLTLQWKQMMEDAGGETSIPIALTSLETSAAQRTALNIHYHIQYPDNALEEQHKAYQMPAVPYGDALLTFQFHNR